MSVETRLRRVISEQLGLGEDEITRDASFLEDLSADSLDRIEICMTAEEEFGIAIDEEQADGWKTFGELVDHVERMIERRKAAANR